MKLYKGLECPLDGYEIVLFSLSGPDGKTYPLCPFCYNNPPFEGAHKVSLPMCCSWLSDCQFQSGVSFSRTADPVASWMLDVGRSSITDSTAHLCSWNWAYKIYRCSHKARAPALP